MNIVVIASILLQLYIHSQHQNPQEQPYNFHHKRRLCNATDPYQYYLMIINISKAEHYF